MARRFNQSSERKRLVIMFKVNVTETLTSSAPGCSGWTMSIGNDNFGANKHQRINSAESPHSSTNSTGPITVSPDWTHPQEDSVSSFGGYQPVEKYWCLKCKKVADDICRKYHVIQNLKSARLDEAHNEILGLETLLQTRSLNLDKINFLNNEVMNSLYASSELFTRMDNELTKALSQLRECIDSDSDINSWNEARLQARMLLEKTNSHGQEVEELQDKSASVFVKTSGGHCWLANEVQMSEHPILVAAVLDLLQKGEFSDVSPDLQDPEEDDTSIQEDASLVSTVVKEESTMNQNESNDWQTRLPLTTALSPSGVNPCVEVQHKFKITQSQESESDNMTVDIPVGLLELYPPGGHGQHHGRKGFHSTKIKKQKYLNSMFRPSLRDVGRSAGTKRILGLQYPESSKRPLGSTSSLDLSWLLEKEDSFKAKRKRDETLQSQVPVRELTGVYCHKDSAFVSNLLRTHKQHLETLVLYAVRREHLYHALEMPKLRKLDVWTCDRPLVKCVRRFNIPQVRASSLICMELNLPRELVRRLVMAVRDSLKYLRLWVGSPGEQGSPDRERWPQCCSTLNNLLLQCGDLPQLKTLTLMRNKMWCHTPGACCTQLESVRAVLPRVLVRCDVCDVNLKGTCSQGTFSQGSLVEEPCEMDECSGEDDSDGSSRHDLSV